MTDQMKAKIPPNSKESEMMVLGCMITNPNSLQIAAEELDDSDFYFTEHKIIFQNLKNSQKNGKETDIHLLCEDLKDQDKLKSVGGAGYITTLAQYVGTSAYIDLYVEKVKNKAILRKLINISQETEKSALEDPENPNHIIEKLGIQTKSLESLQGKKIPIVDTTERLKREDAFLKLYRGQRYLGLRVKTIDEFNENFLGLRGLILLAAAPNIGKTALTVQTAIEVLSTEKDACLVYISLEMTEEQIFRRMLLNISSLNFRTFVFGSKQEKEKSEHEILFTPDEWNSIKNAEKTLNGFGNRLQIIDQSTCPLIDARTVVNYVEALKQRTKSSRSIVIIDYLQVWPTSTDTRFASENEADKWRIGEMKKIRDAMKDDPVIVISEARKPSGKEDAWGGDLSDVMGAARGTYTPDVVMLLSQLKPDALSTIWQKNGLQKINVKEDFESTEQDKYGLAIRNFLSKHGIAICKLEVPKARDGMQKFSILLEFHFHKNTFKKLNWEHIANISNKEIKENSNYKYNKSYDNDGDEIIGKL